MLIEPRTIEDGFAKRFFKNSLRLIIKDITSWVLYLTLLFVISIILNATFDFFSGVAPKPATYIVEIFLKIICGLWILFFGMELAANTDYGTTNKFNVFKQISLSFKHSKLFIVNNFVYLFTLIVAMVLLGSFISGDANSAKKASVNLGELTLFIYDNFILMNQLIFWGLIGASTSNKLFAFPILRQFNLGGYEEAGAFSQKGFKVNPKLGLFKNITLPFGLLVAPIITFVIFLPLVIPFVSLFIYVAFREVFLNKKENEKQESFVLNGKLQTISNSN